MSVEVKSKPIAPKEPSAEKKKVTKSTVAKGPIFIQKIIKGDTYLVLNQAQQFPEDEFQGLYYSTINSSFVFLQPPFDPKYLAQLVTQNNILAQCVEAMEVNIDGTGHELDPIDPEKEGDKEEITRINAFLAEPYPNQSIVSIRRQLRVDLESFGWGAIEVLRNAKGDMVGLRNVPGWLMRWVRLDEPIQVTKTVMRDGKDVEIKYWDRERRYATRTGTNKYTFYRDFGTSRQIDMETGEWESDTKQIDPKRRGSEILMFTVWKDVQTPYGLPRWINQLPSVLGSRKAEESTLEFLDAGGMPPAIFFVEGGTLAADMADQLKQFLSGNLKSKARGVVVEAQSSSGSLDSSGKVSVKTERFGHDAAKDSMYLQYDERMESHVRVGFRLPPLFVGKAQDYNFATAQVGYMVAEAQVFQPERQEFDEVFNRTIMKELDAKTVKYRSKPITLKDATAQITALKDAKGMVEGKDWINEANKVTGLSLKFHQTAQMDENGMPLSIPTNPSTDPAGGGPVSDISVGGGGGGGSDSNPKSSGKIAGGSKTLVGRNPPAAGGASSNFSGVQKATKLAYDFCATEGLILTKFDPSRSEKETIRKSIDELSAEDNKLVKHFISLHLQRALDNGEIGPAVSA
jgi:PBSX family phage portal protein